jgi:hypothetical protein
MHQLSEAELNNKINSFLTKKLPCYTPITARPHEERVLDSRKSVWSRLSEQYTLLVGNHQPVLHRNH